MSEHSTTDGDSKNSGIERPWKVADFANPLLVAGSVIALIDGQWRISVWFLLMAIGIVLTQILFEYRSLHTGNEQSQDTE